jgi:hypothetical protein
MGLTAQGPWMARIYETFGADSASKDGRFSRTHLTRVSESSYAQDLSTLGRNFIAMSCK